MQSLAEVLAEVRRRIENAPKRALNEQNTKATLIEPVLRALGWDVENVEEVQREFRTKRRDKPVDYGLLILRTPRLFIEAKALGSNLADRRWANQIMGYAAVAGVEWIVLTDGNEYRIYNTHAPVTADEKLFRQVRVSDDDPLLTATLQLLARDQLEENRIEVLWRAQFVDQQVHAALRQAFSPDSDLLLVNYVAGQTKNLTTEEIRDSLRRCDVTLDFPVLLEIPKTGGSQRRGKTKPSTKKKPVAFDVSISDLLAAGLLTPGAKLEKRYKGKQLTAKVERDGRVRFEGKLYNSPSQAGGAARATIIGLKKNGQVPQTNGWTFWEVVGGGDSRVQLAALRDQYREGSDQTESAG